MTLDVETTVTVDCDGEGHFSLGIFLWMFSQEIYEGIE